jgi:minor extracellular serine protease Vpr
VTGEGVSVAVLDTGVDYRHPDLGGGFGPGYKVVGGYDFVNEDDDPMDDHGHGTEVAGIVAANGNLKGVAPDANLLAYKVLDTEGSGSESDVIAGIERAIKDGADILSMSFGFLSASVYDPLTWAINYAIVRGVIVVAAAGNEGPYFGTINSPASHKSVIAVGDTIDESILEVRTLEKFDQNASQLLENKKLESLPMKFSPHTSVTGEIAYAGLGYPENFSSANTSFAGKIALIKRGILTFEAKVRNAFNHGAIGAIIFNNESEIFLGTLINKSEIPAVSISGKEGEYLLDLLNASNEPVIVNLTIREGIWHFSSRGPYNSMIKPDLVAPGYMINTTALDRKYVGLAVIKGTSFSAPHVSGACALLLQLHPDWTPGMIKAALMNNAKDLGYGVFEQGAGRVDVLKAVTSEFIATPPSISCVMSSTSSGENKKINIENLQNYTIPVNISVVREQGMYLNFTNMNSTSFDKINVTLDNRFTLHPRENEQIDFTVAVPENYTEGYYCGKIVMKSDNHSISIPFALTLKKSTSPWIFPGAFSTISPAVSNADAEKQREHGCPKKSGVYIK